MQQDLSSTIVPITSHRHIPQLDGIRGLAILSVLIWHYGVVILRPSSPAESIGRWFLMTWSGVDLFFVLSGFLIGGILLDNRAAQNYYQVFYLRRACRIFPLYFLWLALFLIIWLCVPIITTKFSWLFTPVLPLWSYAIYLQNIIMTQHGNYGAQWLAVTWSLAVEEQFYLILPIIIRRIAPKYLPYICLACIIFAPMLRVAVFHLFPPENGFSAAYILLPCRVDILFFGVLCAYIVRQPKMFDWLQQYIRFLYIVLGLLGLGAFGLLWSSPRLETFGMTAYGFTWLALLYSCLLLIAVTEQTGLATRILGARSLRKLGIIAYGVYIVHQTINSIWHGLLAHQIPQLETIQDLFITLGALGCTLLVASLSWQFFEKRIVTWGHVIAYRN
jgi:peptidoglycan/LPS O-acetylase OafA/YrhL